MHLLFVADGERDHQTVPKIVEGILSAEIRSSFRAWKQIRLNRGRGYQKKLAFAFLVARDQNLDGVVATLDSDHATPGERLGILRSARQKDRQDPTKNPLPAALGEAVPHLEAWLLDDPTAVKEVLRFQPDRAIPHVSQGDPKEVLNHLIQESERSETLLQILSEIAASLELNRCNRASVTGLQSFVEDVRREIVVP